MRTVQLRVPARRCCFHRWAAGARKVLRVARPSRPPARVALPCFGSPWLPAACSCFPFRLGGIPWSHVASHDFPLLPVASRGVPCAFPLVITANLSVDPRCLWSQPPSVCGPAAVRPLLSVKWHPRPQSSLSAFRLSYRYLYCYGVICEAVMFPNRREKLVYAISRIL